MVRGDAPGGTYCDNRGRRAGRDVLVLDFSGNKVDIAFGRAQDGGVAKVFVDGDRVARMRFRGAAARPALSRHLLVRGLGRGDHTLRVVVRRGWAFVEGFGVPRR